jgi:hypothetical protein
MRKSPFVNHHGSDGLRQEISLDAKTIGREFCEELSTSSQSISPQNTYNLQRGKIVGLQKGKQINTILTK